MPVPRLQATPAAPRKLDSRLAPAGHGRRWRRPHWGQDCPFKLPVNRTAAAPPQAQTCASDATGGPLPRALVLHWHFSVTVLVRPLASPGRAGQSLRCPAFKLRVEHSTHLRAARILCRVHSRLRLLFIPDSESEVAWSRAFGSGCVHDPNVGGAGREARFHRRAPWDKVAFVRPAPNVALAHWTAWQTQT